MATQQSAIYGSQYFAGPVVFGPGGIVLPAGSVADSQVQAGAKIDSSKLIHHLSFDYAQAPGSAIVAATIDLHVVRGAAGTIKGLQAAITGALANDASRHVTVDLQVSTGAGAFASVLSAVIDLTSASVLRTAVAAALNSTALVVGDILRLVIAVSGGGGTQAQGLAVTLIIAEEPV